jgi:exonuclease SbcC
VVEAKAAVAQRALRDAQARETAERRHLTEARDAVASRRPPPPEGASLQADWEALVTWATTTAGAVADEVAEAEAKVAAIKQESLALRSAIDEACRPVAIEVDPIDGLVRRVAEAQAHARGQLAQDDRDRARATELDDTLAGLVVTRDVADEMGRLLSVKGFERWLLQAALDDLVVRATERLLELSGGQYSLTCDDGEFFVRDHRNADERRGVRTLSGGETFLASLSLALALAENVAEPAAEGGPKLESMFLDEGFGTLDPDTLDLVASSVEELSASGRFVGIVTHIRELADRVPTRFEVSRDAVTARVARVEA